jgi:hypothetical protein
VFQLDADGEWLKYALLLRNLKKTKFSLKGLDQPDLVSTTMQTELLNEWIDDDDHPVTLSAKATLLHYCELNDSELLYVRELLRVYDAARCYFVQWVIDDEFKALVNGARQSATSKNLRFTWKDVQKEILTTLIDLQMMARLLQFANRRRPADTSAKLWVSTRLAERAQMEDTLNPTPILLPEALWLMLPSDTCPTLSSTRSGYLLSLTIYSRATPPPTTLSGRLTKSRRPSNNVPNHPAIGVLQHRSPNL